MIKRSFDLDLLLRATDLPYLKSKAEDFKLWFNMPRNLMFADGENVGLATYDSPGQYTTHWFYKVRGREAINLGKAMCKNLFDNYGAEVLRAFVREDFKASRWGCRQLGFKSYGLITFPDGEVNELFIAPKKDFLDKLKEQQNG